MSRFSIPFLHSVIPSGLIPFANLMIIIIAVFVIYKIFTNARFSKKLTDILRKKIVEKEIVSPTTFEELLLAANGYGVSQVEIYENFPLLDKTLRESGLRKLDIMVLAVEKEGTLVPNPPPDTKILLGDKLICFGKLINMRKELKVAPG